MQQVWNTDEAMRRDVYDTMCAAADALCKILPFVHMLQYILSCQDVFMLGSRRGLFLDQFFLWPFALYSLFHCCYSEYFCRSND